ncbi:MAG TPA: YHS domain-containing (seleno)protein [Xanthomonadales bacterium]|nr:YHS domain-containing (seleno)protein [Xanthomonadales bacterium]
MRASLVISVIAAISLNLLGVFPVDAQMMDKSGGNIVDFLPQNPAECAPDGIANGGYDLVSYRKEGGPKPGSSEFPADFGGMTYLFESEAHRDKFQADPERYLPAYSGWCAVTLALGRLICPDYTNFKIEDDQLLLFELTGFTNGQTLWDSDVGRFRGQANDNYSIVIDFE